MQDTSRRFGEFVHFSRLRLRDARVRLFGTQEALAKAAGCAVGTVANAEDEKPLQPSRALGIVDALDARDKQKGGPGVRLEDLMMGGPEELPTPPGRYPGSAPLPPTNFVGREEALHEIKKKFIRPSGDPRTPGPAIVVVRGIAGLGKTSVSKRVAHDPDILNAFKDGSLWVSLGVQPDILGSLRSWGRSLGAADAHDWTEKEAPNRLAALLATSRRLLLIDDIWDASAARPFLVGGSTCAILLTTRDTEIAHTVAPGAYVYPLPVLSLPESRTLLSKLARDVVQDNPGACDKLLGVLEGLPLAITVAGGFLNMEVLKGRRIENLLAEIEATSRILELQAPIELRTETTPTVAALLKKSTDYLTRQMRIHFAYLSRVRAKPAVFDLDDMKDFWAVDDPAPIAGEFVARGLLELTPEGYYQMHSIMVMHARSLLKRR